MLPKNVTLKLPVITNDEKECLFIIDDMLQLRSFSTKTAGLSHSARTVHQRKAY
jgi:hypothetical protein